DEIGDMSLPVQAKLLRVIQEGTFERLGSNHTQKVDVRIIAATNKNLEQGILHRTFREDLYYRLKVITITLPPLRMRREDILLLTEYFIARHSQSLLNPEITIPRETMDTLLTYAWPGNVRELENVLKRAVLLSKNQILTPDLLSLGQPETMRTEPEKDPGALLATIHFPAKPVAFEGNLYDQVISQAEKELLRQTLNHTRGNQVKAAKLLGISRVKLHGRMKKYGLDQ
ncbi:MAG: sigma 54-interacting transcriptional regulator, partial [Bacteroidota bacterium]